MSSFKVAVGFRKVVMMTAAAICFGLAFLGALLPGLPATPFLLLTSFLLLRTSPELNARLRRSKMFGPILTDWEDYGGVRSHIKMKVVVVVFISVSLTMYFGPEIAWLRWLIGVLAVVGILVIGRLPVAKESDELPDSDAV